MIVPSLLIADETRSTSAERARSIPRFLSFVRYTGRITKPYGKNRSSHDLNDADLERKHEYQLDQLGRFVKAFKLAERKNRAAPQRAEHIATRSMRRVIMGTRQKTVQLLWGMSPRGASSTQ